MQLIPWLSPSQGGGSRKDKNENGCVGEKINNLLK